MYADHRMLVSEPALLRRRFLHIARRLVPIVARTAVIPFHFDRPIRLRDPLDDGLLLRSAFYGVVAELIQSSLLTLLRNAGMGNGECRDCQSFWSLRTTT